MNRVVFTWYAEGAGGSESTHWTWMHTVPSVGQTVHVPLSSDPEDSIARTVHHVAWAVDGDHYPYWHAEVHLS